MPLELQTVGCTKTVALFRVLNYLKTVHDNIQDEFLERWAEILVARHWTGKRGRDD